MLYGNDNPIGVMALSDYSVASKITIADLKNYHSNFMSPNLTSITIIGDIDEATALQNLAFLKKWENKKLCHQ